MNDLSEIETSHLLAILPTLLADERRGLVGFLVHLAEFDRRRGWEALGYGTLWDYCARELRLQKGSIYRRTTAVELLKRFPGVEGRLLSGALTMTSLVGIKNVITEINSEEILTLSEWKSKDEIQDAVDARMSPKVAPAPMVRKLPAVGVQVPVAEGPAAPEAATVVARTVEKGSVQSAPLGDERMCFVGSREGNLEKSFVARRRSRAIPCRMAIRSRFLRGRWICCSRSTPSGSPRRRRRASRRESWRRGVTFRSMSRGRCGRGMGIAARSCW